LREVKISNFFLEVLLLHIFVRNAGTLLTRDVDPKYWKKQPLNPIDFNPVHSFFGENLEGLGAEDIVSKAGWTSVSRQEVAYIRSKDGKRMSENSKPTLAA
jgi:hypothetical protein